MKKQETKKENKGAKNEKGEKVMTFLKHNAYYLIMGICLIAIIAMITIAVVGVNNQPKDSITPPDDNNDNKPIIVEPDMDFILPVAGANVVVNYSNDGELHYNPILDEYLFHGGIDFATSEKAGVKAVLDGEVTRVEKHRMYGYVIEIKHAKDIVTIYRSLEDVKVKVGDTVKKGDVIGFTSTSDISESNLGNHVHFEMMENNKLVNPNKFLTLEEK